MKFNKKEFYYELNSGRKIIVKQDTELHLMEYHGEYGLAEHGEYLECGGVGEVKKVLFVGGDFSPLTKEEKRDIADHMIDVWNKWAEQ